MRNKTTPLRNYKVLSIAGAQERGEEGGGGIRKEKLENLKRLNHEGSYGRWQAVCLYRASDRF